MAVFSEEPSDSEEEGVASDMDIREEVEANKRKKKKVNFAKAAEKAAQEKDSAAHAFSGAGQSMDPEGPAAAAGSSAQGKFVFGRIPKKVKMPTTTHPPFPRPPGVPEEEDGQNDEEDDRGLSQGDEALQRLLRRQSKKALSDEEAQRFFDTARRNNCGVINSSRLAGMGLPRQTVCPMGNGCFSQTTYSDEQHAHSEKMLRAHMKMKHPNAAWDLGSDAEGLTLERAVEPMTDNNDDVLAGPRFWEVPANTAAVALRLPRVAQGVNKFNPLRDYGIAINNDTTWNKVADRQDTTLKLKTFTSKSLRADPKRSRMQAFNDEDGNSAVVAEDVTLQEPANAADAFDAILTWVAARRVAFPIDLSPIALQKAVSEAYFKQRLPKEGYAQVFSDYQLECANKARLRQPPPMYHEVRQMVEHACIDGRAGRTVSSHREAREPKERGDWRMSNSPQKSSPFKKPFAKNPPQPGDKKDRRNFCHSFNTGSCAGAQPGGSCTHDGRSYFHLCSLYVNHGLCGEAHSRRSHEKTLG